MATRSRIPIRVTQDRRTTTTEIHSLVPGHAAVEPGSVESQKVTGPPGPREVRPASGHEAKKKVEAPMGTRSSSRSSCTQSSVSRTLSHNEGQSKAKPAKTRQLQTTKAKALPKAMPTVGAGAGMKRALSWKASESDQPRKPDKKLPKVTTVETHKIHSAQDVMRSAPKLRGTSTGAKRSTMTSQAAVVQQRAAAPLLSASSSLVEQQKALGIAFEADEGALNSILTGRGVTAPLLDRTASLNILTGVKSHFQGLRKGGSAFGTRASVYTSFESRYNLRDGLIPRKPVREDKLDSMRTECLVPVATPFRESCYRTLYKVAERNSVYVKYVTEEEWRSQNLSRTVQPTPGCLTIATPGRVRLGANRQPVLETPFRVEQSANVAQAATARSSARSWRDIFTEKEGDHMPSRCISGQSEKRDDLRRTLTFIESETEGPASDVICGNSVKVADSARLAKAPDRTAATMCRLSEADEELIGIEEIERRLQSEIEAMEHEKMADLERVAQILDRSGLITTQVSGADCSEQCSVGPNTGCSEQASLLDVLQRLSLGSSPELAVSCPAISKPKQRGMQQQLAKASQLATTEDDSCNTANQQPAWLTVTAAEGMASEHRTAAAAEALQTVRLVPAVQTQLAGRHTPDEQVLAAQAASLPMPPSELSDPLWGKQLLHMPAATASSSATAGAMPDEDAADFPTEMEVDHGSEAVDRSRQAGLRSGGEGASLMLLRSLHEDESLRLQSRYIATIDRLCNNAAAVADHRAPEHEPQPMFNPGLHPAAASSATVAASGWDPWPAMVQSACRVTATGAGPVTSASSGPISAWSDAEPDPEARHMPVFRKTAGTISVLHCGIYSPCVAVKLESRSMAADVEVENVGTEQNVPLAQCQQWQTTAESPATRPLAASPLSSLGTIPQSLPPYSSCSVLPERQPVMPCKDHVLCGHPVGCDASTSSCTASSPQPMASGVGSMLNMASTADRVNVCCLPAGLPAIALLPAAIPCLTIAQAGSALSRASLDAASALPHSAFMRPLVSASRTPLGLTLSGGAFAALPPSSAHATDVVPSPMPLDLVQGCGVYSPPIAPVADGSSASTSTPELMYKLSLLGMVFNAAEKFENALLDEECTLYLCRASTRQLHPPLARDLLDPVATSLTGGDDQHFIPIRETDSKGASSATSAQEGSAFHCYTP